MIKTTKNIIILALLVTSSASTAFAVTNPSTCVDITKTLRYDSVQSNSDIVKLQDFLRQNGYFSYASTGYFKRMTESAVKKFQQDNKITPLGIVGPVTRDKIRALTCSGKVSKVTETIKTPNIDVSIFTTPSVVKAVEIKSIPYVSRDFSDWTKNWGDISTSTSKLVISASKDTVGGQANLMTTNSLTDYMFKANVFVRRGVVILVSRYIDSKNYLSCSFSGKNIDLIQVVDGKRENLASTHLAESPYSNFFFNDVNLSMTVSSTTAGCRQVGSEDNVSYKKVDPRLSKGGVGIQVWLEGQGVSSLDVNEVTIESI